MKELIIISDFTIRFYQILNILSQSISTPLIELSKDTSIPMISVFLLGVLGSTAPCQITTNLGAVGYLSKDPNDKKKIIDNTLWYIAGKLVMFLLYGILIAVFNIQLQQASIPVFKFTRKFIGPLVILIGLYILGVIHLRGSLGNSLSYRIEKYLNNNNKFNSSFILGVVFSLAFCPTLFWLFFGLAVPISIKASGGFLLPVIFAVGTTIPMLIIIFLLLLGKSDGKSSVKLVRKLQNFLRILGGLILLVIGFIDTLIYWF